MRIRPTALLLCFSIGILATLTGCLGTSRQTHYFTLNALAEPVQSDSLATSSTIMLRRVKTATYLDRAPMVLRQGEHQIILDDFNQWSQSLSQEIDTTLQQNLTRLLPQSTIVSEWANEIDPDKTISIHILRFDWQDNTANLEGRFILQCKEQKPVIRPFNLTQAAPEKSSAAMPEAYSQVILKLSESIAQTIQGPNAKPLEMGQNTN